MRINEKIKIVEAVGFSPTDAEAWHVKYRNHGYHAEERGLQTHLSFEDYMQKVLEGGITQVEQIGRTSEHFNLGRIGDVGDYTTDNCRFISGHQNRWEAHQNGCMDLRNDRSRGQTKETSEHYRKVSEAMKGRSKQTHAGYAISAEKRAYAFSATDPTGVIHEGRNLKEFCKQRDLNPSHMSQVCLGRRAQHKGWVAQYVDESVSTEADTA